MWGATFLPLPNGESEFPNPRQGDSITVIDSNVVFSLAFGFEPKRLFPSFKPNLNISLRLPPLALHRAGGVFFVMDERAGRRNDFSLGWGSNTQQYGGSQSSE